MTRYEQPSVVALTLFVAFLVASLSCYADLFAREARDTSLNALLIACVLCLALGPLILYTGKCSHSAYALWQPFVGGFNFVFLQLFGWLLWCVSLMSAIALPLGFEQIERFGPISAFGCVALASALTLLASIPLFDPEAPMLRFFPAGVKRADIVAIMCMVPTLMVSLLLDVVPGLTSYRIGLALCCFLGAAAAEFIVLSQLRVANLLLFRHPGGVTLDFVALQLCGWMGHGLGWYFASRLLRDFNVLAVPGTSFGVTVVFCFSSALHLLSISLLRSSSQRGDSTTNVEWNFSKKQWPIFLVGVCAGLCSTVAIFFENVSPLHLANKIALGLLYCCHPAAHFLASRVLPGYFMWQPFVGGRRFVTLQGLAWAGYSLGIFGTILLKLDAPSIGGGWIPPCFAVASMLALYASLRFFDPNSRPTSPINTFGPVQSMNGEMAIGSLMASAGMLLFGVADFSTSRAFANHHATLVATLLVMAATPLAHASGRCLYPMQYRFIQPFVGGDNYVMLQALAWSLWAAAILLHCVMQLNVAANKLPFAHGILIAAGICGLIPYVLIVFSLSAFISTDVGPPQIELNNSHASSRGSLSPEGQKEVRRLLDTVVESAEVRQAMVSLLTPRPSEQVLSQSGESFLTILVGAVLSTGSLFLFVLCEVFAHLLPEELTGRICTPLAVFAFGASMVACLSTHCIAGPKRHPGAYFLWQPFQGGRNYAVLQAIGWGFQSAQLAFVVAALWSLWHGSAIIGLFVALGLFGLTANTALAVSLSLFQPIPRAPTNSFVLRHTEWAVGALMSVGGVAFVTLVSRLNIRAENSPLSSGPVLLIGTIVSATGLSIASFAVWRTRGAIAVADTTRNGVAIPQSSGAPIAIMGEIFLAALVMQRLLFEVSATTVPSWWIICVGLTVLGGQVCIFLALIIREHRTLWSALDELCTDSLVYVVYTLHLSLAFLFVSVGSFSLSTTETGGFFLAVAILSSGHPLAVTATQAALATTFTYGALQGQALWSARISLPLLLYCQTYTGSATIDGHREWSILSAIPYVWNRVAKYFSYRVVSEWMPLVDGHARLAPDPTAPDAQRPKYIFGFHPHGLVPYTYIWGTRCDAWTALLPSPVLHVPSTFLAVPVLRDILMWIGAVGMSPAALQSSLQRSDFLVVGPGGPTELARCSGDSVLLNAKHRGVMRLALQHGAALVPVVCFGEQEIMQPALFPQLQKFLQRTVGVDFPILPCGRFFLPLPLRKRLTVVVGPPLHSPGIRPDPTPTEIEILAARYYADLNSLFERHKAACGYPSATLIITGL